MQYSLFPEIEPYNTFRFPVAPNHELYVEEVGNPKGQPVVFLHGGPGAGLNPKHRRFFDPAHYRIVLFDQRGAGKSTPHASLENNTTWDLVADIEKIRQHLKIEKWMVFGGSWGSTLALAYAETHPDRVTHLVLRGIFLCRKDEIRWFYQEGAHWIFPDVWESYLEPIPVEERGDLVRAFYRQLTSADPAVRMRAAKAWSGWEGATIKLIPDQKAYESFTTDHTALSVARIECHYFTNGAFFRCDEQLLEDAWKIRHIPGVIVHGRYDVVCPVKNAFDLHKVYPEAQLEVIPDSGHAVDEPGIAAALIRATERFKV
ncbi:MAG: prolyl aminopeptidase [Bdellovibrionaceae bacterium]|nr:prolyl aminopeptidase [Pseudobdellovibrionaceae bacterium]